MGVLIFGNMIGDYVCVSIPMHDHITNKLSVLIREYVSILPILMIFPDNFFNNFVIGAQSRLALSNTFSLLNNYFLNFIVTIWRLLVKSAFVNYNIRIPGLNVCFLPVCIADCLFATKTLTCELTLIKLTNPSIVEFKPLIVLLESFLLFNVGVVVTTVCSSIVYNNSNQLVIVVIYWIF